MMPRSSTETAMTPPAPDIFRCSPEVTARFGDLGARLQPYLLRSDPPADALVEVLAGMRAGRGEALIERALEDGVDSLRRPPRALRLFFDALEARPIWVDPARLDRGGQAFLSTGMVGLTVLAAFGLPMSYASADGNKPLIFSGRLEQRARRRLLETGGYVLEVCRPGGLARGGLGFSITARVRLMHAQIRRLLRQSSQWRAEAWGVPINQVYMAMTSGLFGPLLIDGAARLGLTLSEEERADIVHLWRYAGHLMGVEPELNCATEADARRLGQFLEVAALAPDEDSRRLVRALHDAAVDVFDQDVRALFSDTLAAPWLWRSLGVANRGLLEALTRELIGERLADALQLGPPRVAAVRAFKAGVRAYAQARRVAPARAAALGDQLWSALLAAGLAGSPARYALR